MNGADKLCDTLLVNDVDVCFANPGTSEMHFVAALDRKPEMRCILGLFEGVVTAAADGYARMTDRPAATLLHLGPGLANGLANLHNARRARTPMINIVGDHASYHLRHDAPLTSDIESLAKPMSQWVGRARGADDVQRCTEEAYVNSLRKPGVSTMILPADAAWSDVSPSTIRPVSLPARPSVERDRVLEAAELLRGPGKVALILGSRALREGALTWAGRIAAATGAMLLSETSARIEQGAGRVATQPIPYSVDLAVKVLADLTAVIRVGGKTPVAFFGYPDKPSTLLPAECKDMELAGPEHDLESTLHELADELGLDARSPHSISSLAAPDLPIPTEALNPDSISVCVARFLPQNAIVCNESLTSAGRFSALAPMAQPHDFLTLTGGAIGIGISLSVGAAVACPDRKVVTLQADGSGMYNPQGLWTQAREKLDVLTIIFSNRAYAILQGEMRNVGVNAFGRNARRMLEIDDPALDWCSLAKAMGVEAGRATTVQEFLILLQEGLSRRGPFLIEAII